MTSATTYAAYGLAIDSDRRWPGLDPAARAADSAPRVRVLAAPEPDLRAHFSGPREPGRTRHTGDGVILTLRGRAGDLLLDGGAVGLFHLAPDGSRLLYAAPDPGDPACARMLLDTALGTAALRRGYEGLHAAGVTIGGRLVAITADEGGGKTSLAAALLERGGELFSDDLLFLSQDRAAVLAHPGPALINLPCAHDTAPPGEILATLGDEHWVALPRQARDPLALSLVVVLDRRPGAGDPETRPERSPTAIIGHALDSGPGPERLTRRLDVLARVAREAAIVRLTAGPAASPQALAQVLVAVAASLPPAPAAEPRGVGS